MYKLLLLSICLPLLIFAQNNPTYYTNTLKDNNGQPIVGATISNTTTYQATSTDNKGYFKIRASIGDVVTISSIGYGTSRITITKHLLEVSTSNSLQPVAAIISNDYTSLIKNTTFQSTSSETDSTNNISYSKLKLGSGSYLSGNIANLSVHNNQLYVQPYYTKKLNIGGGYSSTIEINKANNLPALQTLYAQGGPLNGKLSWQGAEIGELFSFGPAITYLYYDDNNYAYDINGKLVSNNTGKEAQAYNNSIFQTAVSESQLLNFHSSFYNGRSYQPTIYFSFNAGQTGQSTIIQQNRNRDTKIGSLLVANLKQASITGSYNYQQSNYSKGNRNGFLNRVYQNGILTPVSFENAQGYLLSTGQRSYSNMADNPYFLLNNNDNNYFRSQQNTGLTIEQKKGDLSYKLVQSLESVEQRGNETYKKGTVSFEEGIATQRLQKDNNYSLQANASYSKRKNKWSSAASANYLLSINRTSIQYTNPEKYYLYNRSANDISLNLSGSYSDYRFDAGGTIANKLYFSNTANRSSFLLPSLSGYFYFKDVLDDVNIKLVSSWHSFNSELPLHQSLAYINLLQLTTQQFSKYFPVQEVDSYKGVQPIKHSEWNGRVEVDYDNKVSLSAELFVRHTNNDIVPVYGAGKLKLNNLANHVSKGVELNLSINGTRYYYSKIHWSNNLSFIAYNSKVTHVKDGYNYLPVAGFSDVHKTLVKGEPLGVITGSAWLRDKNGNQVIGADGFPLVDPQEQIIGNPIPDFVMKMSNTLSRKAWGLQVDCEWRKGGDVWNGTEAVLDYYGRSASTGQLRNTTKYIFTGVMQNGEKNNIPVTFLNPSKPVETNRWTRYGYSGVAEAYIQRGDYLRIHSISLSYKHRFKKIIQNLTLSAYAGNIILWSAYKGADPRQLLLDQPNTEGLDFFNLPSTKSFGVNASIQF